LLLHPLLVRQRTRHRIFLSHYGFSIAFSQAWVLTLSGCFQATLLHTNCCTTAVPLPAPIGLGRGAGITSLGMKKINGYFISTCRLAPGKLEWEDFLLYQMLLGAAAEMCNLKFKRDSLPYYKN